jgi:hypothetical protein
MSPSMDAIRNLLEPGSHALKCSARLAAGKPEVSNWTFPRRSFTAPRVVNETLSRSGDSLSRSSKGPSRVFQPPEKSSNTNRGSATRGLYRVDGGWSKLAIAQHAYSRHRSSEKSSTPGAVMAKVSQPPAWPRTPSQRPCAILASSAMLHPQECCIGCKFLCVT